MGAKKGSISYTLYHVQGDLPDGYRDVFLDKISEFAFRALTPESEEDTSWGWSVLDDILATEFRRDAVFVGEYLCLSLRVDRWSLPKPILTAEIERRAAELLERQEDRGKLYRSEKDEIRDAVTAELKRRTLPSTQVVDVVWSIQDGAVRLWSQSTRMLETFESLFESTFGLRLLPSNPYVAAMQSGLDPALVAAFDGLQPAPFTAYD